MDPHLILHACSTRFCKMGGSDLDFALANKDRNRLVSSDQRPPQPRPRERPTEPCDVVLQARDMFSPSGDVPPAAQRHLHSPMRRNRHSAMPAELPRRGAVRPPGSPRAVDHWIGSNQVEIAKHRISHDSASCFPADARPSTFHRKTPSSQDPCSST